MDYYLSVRAFALRRHSGNTPRRETIYSSYRSAFNGEPTRENPSIDGATSNPVLGIPKTQSKQLYFLRTVSEIQHK